MILTGSEIESQVKADRIVIDPFDAELLNPNSYNYKLGASLKIPEGQIADPKIRSNWQSIDIPTEGIVLQPNRLYLGHTSEKIGSNHFVTSLIGRSSLGRLGLYLQVSADLGQLGVIHQWTLELTTVQPLRVYPNMRIGQVSFWCVKGSIVLYAGRYQGTDLPTPSRFPLDYLSETESDWSDRDDFDRPTDHQGTSKGKN